MKTIEIGKSYQPKEEYKHIFVPCKIEAIEFIREGQYIYRNEELSVSIRVVDIDTNLPNYYKPGTFFRAFEEIKNNYKL